MYLYNKATYVNYNAMFTVCPVFLRPAGLEPTTYGFEVRYSILMSYRRFFGKGWMTGFEPATPRSTIWDSNP